MKLIIVFISFILTADCRSPYDLGLPDKKKLLLVIEGNLNPLGTISVRLTHTSKLDANSTIPSENKAQVTVEGQDNSSDALIFSGNGNYITNAGFVIGNEYRVRIRTTSGREYLSQFIKAQQIPDIDSMSWELASRGVYVQANTHDLNDPYYSFGQIPCVDCTAKGGTTIKPSFW